MLVRRLASARMVTGREKCLHARNPKSKFRESDGGSIWSAEGQQGEHKIDAPSGAPQSELDSRVIWQGFETVMLQNDPQICWEIRIVTANGAFSKCSLLPNPIVADENAKAYYQQKPKHGVKNHAPRKAVLQVIGNLMQTVAFCGRAGFDAFPFLGRFLHQ